MSLPWKQTHATNGGWAEHAFWARETFTEKRQDAASTFQGVVYGAVVGRVGVTSKKLWIGRNWLSLTVTSVVLRSEMVTGMMPQ